MKPDFTEIIPSEKSGTQLHSLLLGSIRPRPIALASTIDGAGKPNLAPFSYFNVFSTNPPLLIFAPNRSGRTGLNKDTVNNIMATFEVVINVVNYDMVEQVNLTSVEFPEGVNEFEKAGFTAAASTLVKPFRVLESPVQLECKVREVIVLGSKGGSGNLILCEVINIHVNNGILDSEQNIDPNKLDLVARMGANWYCRANGEALFEVKKPNNKKVLGFDNLPLSIRYSTILTGNDLAKLAMVPELPHISLFEKYVEKNRNEFISYLTLEDFHRDAKLHISENNIQEAWHLLMVADKLFIQQSKR